MPTPQLPPALLAQIARNEAALRKAFVADCADEGAWKAARPYKGVAIRTARVRGSPFHKVLGEHTLSFPFEAVDAFVATQDLTLRPSDPPELRNGVRRRTVLAEPRRGLRIVHSELESPSRLVRPRDFLVFSATHRDADGRWFVVASVDADELAPVARGCVRMRVNTNVMHFAPDGAGTTRCRLLLHCDPCGSIPPVVYNAVARQQATMGLVVERALAAQRTAAAPV